MPPATVDRPSHFWFCRRDEPSCVDTPGWEGGWATDKALLTREADPPVRGISHAIGPDIPHCCLAKDSGKLLFSSLDDMATPTPPSGWLIDFVRAHAAF